MATGVDGDPLDVAAPADRRPAIGMRHARARRSASKPSPSGLSSVRKRRSSSTTWRSRSSARWEMSRLAKRSASRSITSGSVSRGHVLEVDRHVAARVGVDLTAALGDQLRMRPPPATFFEPLNIMCSKRWAMPGIERFVCRAGIDPDLRRDDRGAMVLERHDAHSVVEGRHDEVRHRIDHLGIGFGGSWHQSEAADRDPGKAEVEPSERPDAKFHGRDPIPCASECRPFAAPGKVIG